MNKRNRERIVTLGKALANEKRVDILDWLKAPEKHFPEKQRTGSTGAAPGRVGISTGQIARKLGVSDPTASRHLQILKRAGLISESRNRHWTLHSRNESAIDKSLSLLVEEIQA